LFNLICYPELCTGCRSCEIACSYHHTKSFSRKKSSIHINRLERKGEFEIIFNWRKTTDHPTCDMCRNEETPLCAKFCAPGAIVLEE
jgi:carbon-monoxide dehydrogenase iron sulfur subunit